MGRQNHCLDWDLYELIHSTQLGLLFYFQFQFLQTTNIYTYTVDHILISYDWFLKLSCIVSHVLQRHA